MSSDWQQVLHKEHTVYALSLQTMQAGTDRPKPYHTYLDAEEVLDCATRCAVIAPVQGAACLSSCQQTNSLPCTDISDRNCLQIKQPLPEAALAQPEYAVQ